MVSMFTVQAAKNSYQKEKKKQTKTNRIKIQKSQQVQKRKQMKNCVSLKI